MGFAGRGSDDDQGDPTTVSPVVVQAPKLSERPGWGLVGDIAGKVWNAPNTALGLLYGGAGMAVGEVGHLLGLQKNAPGVRWRDNAVQFTDNPFGGVGALTLGNTTAYRGDPYDPADRYWYPHGEDPRTIENGHSIGEHEAQHTYQGQELGPAYLPSNIAGGLMGLLFDRDPVTGKPDWHGPHNWNERGPQDSPPTPWGR
jgi:hypothetical protein